MALDAVELRGALEALRRGTGGQVTVAEAAELIRAWNPQPPPRWIAPMPSLNGPTLVPEVVERLGEELGLPVYHAVHKLFATEEQKGMQSSSFQARNLDGSLEVEAFAGMEQAGLFVDDMYDSGWTVALLRRAGAGIVYPFTLSKASGRE